MSPTFRKEKGYAFKIYSNEENRMHIHVVKEDKSAKFWLEPNVELSDNDGFSKIELNKIRKIVVLYAEYFKEQYRKHIGKRIDD